MTVDLHVCPKCGYIRTSKGCTSSDSPFHCRNCPPYAVRLRRVTVTPEEIFAFDRERIWKKWNGR